MTRTKIVLLTLLLAPAAASAATVEVDFSGQLDAYAVTPGSSYPQTLTDTSVSGVFTFNTSLLPTPDAGNPPGVVSFSGSNFLQSSVQWSGATLSPEAPGSAGSNTLYIDTNAGLCTIQDDSTYMDALGIPHQAEIALNFSGLSVARLLAPGSGGSLGVTSGSGDFFDLTSPTDGSLPSGVEALFIPDSVSVKVVGVPGPDSASLGVGMLLAAMVAMIRVRRRQEAREPRST
jgi:hypothetical protein